MRVTPEDLDRFLGLLARTGNATEAARATGHDRVTYYTARRRDPAFAERWEAALDSFRADLEAEARRRAMGYYDEKVDAKGNVVRFLRHSDSLLLAMLRRHVPEYRDHVTVREEGPDLSGLARLSQEQRDELRRHLEAALASPDRVTVPDDADEPGTGS